MEKYEILEKHKEVKLSGTYRIRLIGIEFLTPNAGRNYISLKAKGMYAQKETPVVVIPVKYGHYINRLDSLFVKNPEIGTYSTFRLKYNGREIYHRYPYIYFPRLIESPKVIDGEIWIVKCWGKNTTYKSGGTNPLYDKEQVLYKREFISKSGTGRHWDEYYIIVTRPNSEVKIV